jgi:hypothetical protein
MQPSPSIRPATYAALRRLIAPIPSRQKVDYVLDKDQRWPQFSDGPGDVEPQAAARSLPQTGAFPGAGDVLAGKPGAQHVHRLNSGPVHGGDIPEVRHRGEPVGEDGGRPRVVVRDEREFTAEDSLHGHSQALIA